MMIWEQREQQRQRQAERVRNLLPIWPLIVMLLIGMYAAQHARQGHVTHAVAGCIAQLGGVR